MSEKEIAWDLSEIFAGCDDPKISESMDALLKDTDEIVKGYRGKINTNSFSAQNLFNLLKKQEKILADMEELKVFSVNLFNANMTVPETENLYNKFKDFHSTILKKLAFLEIEIGKLINENPQLIDDESLINYKNYLFKVKRRFPFKLSVKEEKLILEKDQYGVIAWEQLRDSWISSRKFKVIVEGEEKIISFSDFMPLAMHPDRETRLSVFKSVSDLLGKDESIISSALRNICSDWVKMVNLRNYNSHMHQSLIDFNTKQNIIDNLMKTIEENIHIYHRFLKIKAKLLNLPKLHGADIWGRLPFKKKYTWEETKELTIRLFSNFDKEFGEIVSDIFERHHIDASTREGKSGGAYCSPWFNGRTVFILTSFKGLINDVLPLAHELGHGIHCYLSSREQTFINYIAEKLLAESASNFGELLLAEHLLKFAESSKDKITILTNELTGTGSVLFYVSARMWFEQSLYDAIQKGEFLDGNTISEYWCSARDKIFGDSVDWFDEMKWLWMTTPHYFFSDTRFYNYPYVYGKLFVYALYKSYKNEGESFIPKFKKLLSLGDSLSPEELGKIVGMDVTKPDFWQLGIKQFEEFVEELEKLIELPGE
ncbi:MAG: M3 family metallopeptidase [Promethearchaeota archaeon]